MTFTAGLKARAPFAPARRLAVWLMAACLPAVVAGCVDVVNTGTVIVAPQIFDGGADNVRPAETALTPAEICTMTGGRVEIHSCCDIDDFGVLCWRGYCCGVGTPGAVMKDVSLCICPEHQCFTPTPLGPGTRAGCNPEIMSSPRPDAATAS